ncbi:GDSL-type esterase/lipase family protein [Bacillus salitolerans]|uniref:GDSL-type esterase/lipase family protein n=1 Tax=Bacillus salitolerans TaxID=1437434 RepID=A0ABW4LTC2_9BACI
MLRLILLLVAAIVFTVISKPSDGFNRQFLINDYQVTNIQSSTVMKQVDANFFPMDIHIVAIGDSLTIGYGDSDNGGYLATLEAELLKQREIKNVTIENYGVGGFRSTQLVDKLDQSSVKYAIQDADIVLITIGGNDIIQVVQENFFQLNHAHFEEASKKYVSNIHGMVGKINAINPNSQIFLLGVYNPLSGLFPFIPEIDLIVENWNEQTALELGKYENTHFVPLFDVFKGNEELYLYEDYIHPNNNGYEHIANRVFSYLEQYQHESTYVNGKMD